MPTTPCVIDVCFNMDASPIASQQGHITVRGWLKGFAWGGLTDGPVIKKKRRSDKKTSPDYRRVDSWEVAGEAGVWRRKYRTKRLVVVTLFKVAAGPDARATINKLRVTEGTLIRSKKEFNTIDGYAGGSSAHSFLSSA